MSSGGRSFALLGTLLVAACGGVSEPSPSGLDEPIRVRYSPPDNSPSRAAQFFRGTLPVGQDGPTVPNFLNTQGAAFQGQQGKKMEGVAGDTATAVALKFDGIGSGYWIAPVRTADANTPGTLGWTILIDIARDVPLGRQTLQVVAVDAAHHYGPMNTTPLNILAWLPSGAAVASLTWDSNADLDLQIITPSGKQVDAKHVSTDAMVDGGYPPGSGLFDQDSNASCVPDGRRQEDLIWATPPTPGLYLAKVDMFSACGEPVANFKFQVFVNNDAIVTKVGRLLGSDADNGTAADPAAEIGTRAAATPLAITNFSF
jgi:hypothetical protein